MLTDQDQKPIDSRILKYFTINDLDLQSIQQYRQRFASFRPTHPWLSENDQGLLTKLGGWREDRETGEEGLTLAGLLMFGTEESLRDKLPSYNLDYREKLSDDRWSDRLTVDGTWSANLFQFYLRVIQRLEADIKIPFQLNSDLFRQGTTIVHESVREALVNSLIHADYQGIGGIVIEKYPDRFEFSNPGSLLISKKQLLQGGISECRNKSLQTMFTQIGAAEKAGSGVDKIFRGWNSQHWRPPIVIEQLQPERVEWILPMISLIPKESSDRLEKHFKDKFYKFTPNEIQALVTADIEEYVDNVRMRQITGEHPTDITRLLQDLVKKDALVPEGQGRWSRYRLPRLDSLHNENHSLHNENHSLHNENHSLHNEQGLPDTQQALTKIAEPAKLKKRLRDHEMEKIILELCQEKWLTRKEISELIGRNSEGIRSRFLNPMVKHGLLRLRYPDKPNRQDQSYTTVNEAISNLGNEF